MQYNFSRRISELKPSTIREILKVTQDPEVISFAAGNPAPEAFPVADMARIGAEIFQNDAARALQYGVSEGYTPLREATAGCIRTKFGIGGPDDELIIMSGGQQGIELAAKALVNEDDVVVCENPSFIGALNAFRSYKARLVGVPLEEDGMDVESLEKVLKTTPNVRLLYVIPTFQNPTGRTTSLAKRKRILELAERYGVMVLEDNPYFELRYSGEDVPTLKSLDIAGCVIYVGSYSKILAPGIRLGFACANREVISKMVVAKQVSDVHTNLFFQMLAAEYLNTCDLDAHIRAVRDIYRAKRDHMLAAMDACFGGKAHAERPDGGLFIWCTLPDGYDGVELCRRAGERKVAAVPGAAFLADEGARSGGVRLNFSLPTMEQIDRGIDILGQVLKEYVR